MCNPIGRLIWILLSGGLAGSANFAAEPSNFAFKEEANQLVITRGSQPVATYVFRDGKILRPFFAHVHAPGGIPITRHHPPIAGQDATDHDTMHPGIWLAFGDINGQDFWRNKAVIQHERFIEPPSVRDGGVHFAALNRLLTKEGKALGTQISRVSLRSRSAGYLLIWEALFEPAEGDLVFGDQEEMGLGVRMATAITEKNGGTIRNRSGAKTAKATWGQTAEWSDYSGVVGPAGVGVTLMPDPKNFRASWFHNRDYGLMVANPFGRKAMKQGDTSRVEVKKGERLRLRFGVLLYCAAQGQDADPAAAYRDFLDQALKQR